MNSNLNRALAATLVTLGGVAPAFAQFDWDGFCIDRNSTQPYSNPFLFGIKRTPLFEAAIGFEGTVAYGSQCQAGSAPIRGRIGFSIGPRGSVQDNLPGVSFDGINDDYLRLTVSSNFIEQGPSGISYAGPYLSPATGGMSYARIFVQNADGTLTQNTGYLYGSNGLNLAFEGPRSRYIYTESTVNGTDPTNSIGVRCVIDVLADAARVNWRLTNNLSSGNPVGLGLWFGQVVALVDKNGSQQVVPYGSGEDQFFGTYITIPGRRPLSVQERFNNTGLSPNGEAEGATVGVPPFVNFSASQSAGFGLQVVNNPTALQSFDPDSVVDQTPVDEFVIGDPVFLVDGRYTTTDPVFNDFIFNAPGGPPGNQNADAAEISPSPAYLQKWLPNFQVGQGGFRDIVAYYRSTNGDSSYSPSFTGYAAVVDTPKSISTESNDPNSFNPNPFTIRVNVDNTGGFSNNDALVQMQSVQVVLNLPAGMHAPNSTSRTITKFVRNVYNGPNEVSSSRIASGQIGFVDFQVEVDPNTFGALQYNATITPQPGFASKSITGTINVATTPKLLVRTGANLVSPPWQFADNSFDAVLNLDLNADYRAYAWDAQVQRYVPSTSTERGEGRWIISNGDLGFRSLGGSPQQPDDQFPDPNNYDAGGAPLVRLYRGWNLVGNPYNYAIPLGQIIGIPVNQNNLALQYRDLVAGDYTDGAFSYYDQDARTYRIIQGEDARLQPNYGYWIYANQDFDIQFPPIYELFVRSAPAAPAKQRFDNWKLQLSASTTNAADTDNFVGIARKKEDATALSVRKAPIPPTADAVRAYIVNGTRDMAQQLRWARGKQTFSYNVYTKARGPVVVSWPNLKQIPSNLAVSVVDLDARKTIDARRTTGYTYQAVAGSERRFTVTVTPMGTVAQRIGSASATLVTRGSVKSQKVSYFLSGRGSTTVRVFKGRTLLGTIVNDADAVAGTNSFLWPMTDGNAQPLPNGSYTLEIAATGEGGDTAVRQLSVNVRH